MRIFFRWVVQTPTRRVCKNSISFCGEDDAMGFFLRRYGYRCHLCHLDDFETGDTHGQANFFRKFTERMVNITPKSFVCAL